VVAEKILFKTLLACASLCTLEVSDYSVNLSAMCLYGEFASSINIRVTRDKVGVATTASKEQPRAVKRRAQLIRFTPKLGGPFGQPVRLSRNYLPDQAIGQDFSEALLRLVRLLPSQARFGHGRPLLQDQPRAEGASR